jgi:hypothetical protein
MSQPIIPMTPVLHTKLQPVVDSEADALALYAATAGLLEEGREKGFHHYALHLRVAMLELEAILGKTERARRPRTSAAMRQLIRDQTGS